jgi:hypothetical protein
MASRVLALIVVALGCVLGWQWWNPPGAWQAPPPVAPEIARLSEIGIRARSMPTSFDQALARPVFWPSRRPRVVAVPVEPNAAAATDLKLLGLVRGGEYWAIIQLKGETFRVPVGGQVGGWRLDAIDGDEAVLARNGEGMVRIRFPKQEFTLDRASTERP